MWSTPNLVVCRGPFVEIEADNVPSCRLSLGPSPENAGVGGSFETPVTRWKIPRVVHPGLRGAAHGSRNVRAPPQVPDGTNGSIHRCIRVTIDEVIRPVRPSLRRERGAELPPRPLLRPVRPAPLSRRNAKPKAAPRKRKRPSATGLKSPKADRAGRHR